MRFEMKMPDLATTGSEIRVIRWLVETGAPVKRGQPLLEVETDKATMEVESVVAGTLTEHVAAEGDEIASGGLLAVFEVAGAAAQQTADSRQQTAGSRQQAVAAPLARAAELVVTPAAPPVVVALPQNGRRVSFFERNRRARAAREAPPTLSPVQRAVGRRLQHSKSTVPHFYLQATADAETLVARRAACDPARRVAWDAFFARAAARALREFPRLAHRIQGEDLVPAGTEAVGIAVDLEGELFVAPVTDPAERTPEEISDELRAGVERLRSGDPDARRVRPATITITNLGGSGIDSFLAILNPPEAAILAVGKIGPAVVVHNGAPAVRQQVSLSLSVDHRVASGKYAAAFLGAVIREIESS
jgi:pyruvate dehydrogenase E2 component (dihydrolipoamide acetyltransferase)